MSQKSWDLSSLKEIIGDYDRTLRDCEKLLRENHEYTKNRGFVYNLDWNYFIQPKIDHLRKRLQMHNSKILILLKPLELDLLAEIHHDLAQRIDRVHETVLRLEGLLISDIEKALSEQQETIPQYLEIPVEIEQRFHSAAERTRPQSRSQGRFPLIEGADAFATHFENGTKNFVPGNFVPQRKPPGKQYLNLLKCIWIIKKLEASDQLRDVPADSHWKSYIVQLGNNLSEECKRFLAPSTRQLLAPDLSMDTSSEDYEIWVDEDVQTYISPHKDPFMTEIKKLPLPAHRDGQQRTLTVYKQDATKYRFEETVESKDHHDGVLDRGRTDIDLATVIFIPLYAIPSSSPKALEVIIRSSHTETQPDFQEAKQILDVQHLITGYKVFSRYDQGMVKVSFFVSDEAKPVEEHGRVQLWLPKPYAESSTTSSPATSETGLYGRNSDQASIQQRPPHSPGSTIRPSQTPNGMSSRETIGSLRHQSNRSLNHVARGPSTAMRSPDRTPAMRSPDRTPAMRSPDRILNERSKSLRDNPSSSSISTNSILSNLTGRRSQSQRSQTKPSNLSVNSTASTSRPNRVGSIMTVSSNMSRRTVSSVTTVSTGAGKAHLHEKPDKPMLVIFLKSRDNTARLAIVAIQIDDATAVNYGRCDCHSASSQCRSSCIERKGGYLSAQRWDAGDRLENWNLAKLGMQQRKELPADSWEGLKRVSFKFQSREGTWTRSPCDVTRQVIDTYSARYTFAGSPCECDRHMTHGLSKCIIEGHQGVFGQLHRIGSQRLQNYHDARDDASKKPITLGSLPEDEERE